MLANALLTVLPLVPAVLAGPVQSYQVTPGPGLPSLESLGITSEQLYKMEPAASPIDARAALAPNYNGVCETEPDAYVSVGDLRACYNYLTSIGSWACTVPSGLRKIRYCVAGEADVNGQSIIGISQTSSCSAVAYALLDIIDRCTRQDNKAAGSQAAYNNGDIIVTAIKGSFV